MQNRFPYVAPFLLQPSQAEGAHFFVIAVRFLWPQRMLPIPPVESHDWHKVTWLAIFKRIMGVSPKVLLAMIRMSKKEGKIVQDKHTLLWYALTLVYILE
jgi:hypothetical protein